ncbi:ThiF family adenylyltransferase [Nocardiopsis sp. NPDC049922]|uniref:HesA/MoeB/ThiF family protein n=1 Tax=Nocardiopsis sp. NPDC049922 TaxID=3155157 RepID=UPI0033C79E0C
MQGQTLFLGFGSIQQAVTDARLWEPLIRLADYQSTPRTRSESLTFLTHDLQLDTASAEALVLLLESGRFLIPAQSYDPRDRYSRHALFYELSGEDSARVQKRLADSHVLLLGCGGIGNLVATTLATAGVGTLTLVDDDQVELSNLTRQFLFTEADVGQPKCEVLAREVTRRNSHCRVRAFTTAVTDRTDLAALAVSDLLVVSADSPGLTRLVNTHAVASGQEWLNVCYVNDIAVWGPLVIPGVTGCWDCQPLTAHPPHDDPDLAALIKRVNSRYQAPSNGPVNMVASALAALDVLRRLGGFGVPASLNRRVGVWSHELTLDEQPAERDPLCPTCARATPTATDPRATEGAR